jgi:hypothetical protein
MKDSELLFAAIHRYLAPTELSVFDQQQTGKANYICVCVMWMQGVSAEQIDRVVRFVESFLKEPTGGAAYTFTGYPPHNILLGGPEGYSSGEIQMLRYMWALNLVELLKIEEGES